MCNYILITQMYSITTVLFKQRVNIVALTHNVLIIELITDDVNIIVLLVTIILLS